jgi:hypothetical protein
LGTEENHLTGDNWATYTKASLPPTPQKNTHENNRKLFILNSLRQFQQRLFLCKLRLFSEASAALHNGSLLHNTTRVCTMER